jgi:large subunit ribosomal protein L7/L12
MVRAGYYAPPLHRFMQQQSRKDRPMTERTAAVLALGDQIAGLTLSEAAALRDYLAAKYRIEPAGRVVIAPPESLTDGPEKPICCLPEPSVVLEGLASPAYKISVLKALREITGCGLVEGRTLVESAPKVIKEFVPREEAERLLKKLTDAGAKASLK